MNRSSLFKKRLRVRLLAPDRIPPALFDGSRKRFKAITRREKEEEEKHRGRAGLLVQDLHGVQALETFRESPFQREAAHMCLQSVCHLPPLVGPTYYYTGMMQKG